MHVSIIIECEVHASIFCNPSGLSVFAGLNFYFFLCPVFTGPEAAILDWYGHCMRALKPVNKLGGSWDMLRQENLFQIRHSEIASEAMFEPKCY